MIQIQENDLFWFFYKRNFKGWMIPPPKNLCNYFWNAVQGSFKYFLEDVHIVITTVILWLITYGLILLQNNVFFPQLTSTEPKSIFGVIGLLCLGGFFIVTLGFFGILAVLMPIIRFCEYWSERNPALLTVVGILVLFLFTSLVFSTTFAPREQWQWYYLLISMAIEVSVILVILLLGFVWWSCFTTSTNFGKNVLQYLSALKSGTCPLVEPPQSYKDDQRKIDMNCGDS